MSDLPHGERYTSPGAKRWTQSRKANLIDQVLDGEITVDQALADNGLTADEFNSWVTRFGKGGYAALADAHKRSTAHVRAARAALRSVAVIV
jgi:transposase-like protein